MFTDRQDAGKKLADKLREEFREDGLEGFDPQSAIILAVPRGGIIVGKELAQKLNLPLEVLVTKKIPAPDNPELAIGAIGERGVLFWDEDLCRKLCVTEVYKKKIVEEKTQELKSKVNFFRQGRLSLDLKGKTAVLTDDGVATGATISTAIKVVKKFKPKQVFLAIPVIALDALEKLKKEVDKVYFLWAPEVFFAVGEFYRNFDQVSDQEVHEILHLKSYN
jgi:predicted phosphoribosyltransferase